MFIQGEVGRGERGGRGRWVGERRGGWKVLEKLGNEGIAGVFDGDLAEVGRLIDEVG